MKAKNKEEFERIWNAHFNQTSGLMCSLPKYEVLKFCKALKDFKKFIKIASNHTYDKEGKEK